MDDGLDITTDGAVLRVVMNRPSHLNAMSADMADLLAETLEGAAGRDDVRAVLLTGAGGAFSSGADLSGADAGEPLDGSSLDRANRIIRAIVALPKPCVAAVRGFAAGVGCSMALACDLVVAAESASFLLAFARIGLMPDGGASATVAASMGRARAMRMALLGEPVTGKDAYDAGLVSHACADDDLDGVVEKLLARLAGGPPVAYAATKQAVNAATLHQLDAALERERTGQTALLGTADAAEGIRAFVERRRPGFTGH
jgi:enoyl-CoA hydratase